MFDLFVGGEGGDSETPSRNFVVRSNWLRKRVPGRFRALVGRSEVWRSLETTDRRAAIAKCAALNDELEKDWQARLEAQEAGEAVLAPNVGPVSKLSLKRAVALAGAAYREFIAAHTDEPGTPEDWDNYLERDKARLVPPLFAIPLKQTRRAMFGHEVYPFLAKRGLRLDEASLDRFFAEYIKARELAQEDLKKQADSDYSSENAKRFPEMSPVIDAKTAFARYAAEAELRPSTIKRWSGVIDRLTEFLGHNDLGQLTRKDIVAWKNTLISGDEEKKIKKKARKSVRDVYLAAVKATCQYLVDNFELEENPVIGRGLVRNVKNSKNDKKKGFSDKDATTILTANSATPSNLISTEMAAARRWIPWICAYTGARVNEITSLLPTDFDRLDGIECIVRRPLITKGDEARTVPLHDHLIEQGLMPYVLERRKLDKPLFYDPARSRGAQAANPHYKKVGQRIAEWVGDLKVDHAIAPNHGWRHRWQSSARDVRMHQQIANFLIGHGDKDVSSVYGEKWTKTLYKEIMLIPRYEIPGLLEAPAPHRGRERRVRKLVAA